MKKIIILLCMLLCTCTAFAEDESTDDHVTHISYEVQAQISFINGDVIINQLVSVGDKLIEPSHTDKAGYKFVGWSYNDKLWDFKKDIVEEHMDLYATYIPLKLDGQITNSTDPKSNYLGASLTINEDDIYLSEQDLVDLANGYTMDIKLIVTSLDESQIDSAIKDKMLKAISDDGNTIGIWFDANIIKTINGRSEYITQTKNKIKITLNIPEEIRKPGRMYSLYRFHDGVAEKIFEGEADSNWNIEFETNRFSIYAIAYKDKSSPILIPPSVKPVVDTAAMVIDTIKQHNTFKILATFGILVAIVPLLKDKRKK